MILKKILNLINKYELLLKYCMKNNISLSRRISIPYSTNIRFSNHSNVEILDNFSTRDNCNIIVSDNGVLKIGKKVMLNTNVTIDCRQKIIIGNNIIMGPNISIFDNDHNFKINNNDFRCKEIIIEDNVWIASGVIILKGTHIGKNSVVAAGAVVLSDVPENSIYYSKDKIVKIDRKEKINNDELKKM